MSLKDLTHEAHKEAETKPFVKVLFSGKIDPKLYALYLKNQHPCYEILEVCSMMHPGLLGNSDDARRAPAINADFEELWNTDTDGEPTILPVVKRYIDYIMSIKDDPKKLLAHIYVRHFGDMAGGQQIAKRVPGSGRMYHFKDADALKASIREKLSDDMADEARVCFKFAGELFEEMMTLAPNE
jgi:heme oxygenase (biliverdin-producing, ferredoxin)